MKDDLRRWTEYHEAYGHDYLLVNDAIWTVYQRMIVPDGPACRDFTVSSCQQRTLLSHFKKAALLRYTDGCQAECDNPPWYAVTCDRFLDLADCSANTRSKIRRGLKKCEVAMVDAEYIARHGYDVFMAAYAKYTGVALPTVSNAEWAQRALISKNFPDLRHYWAALIDGRLVAYSANTIYGTTEASYSEVKLHPDFLKAYPSYALFFKMNEYYLRDQAFQYVNDGFRSIKHETNIQDFLMEKFGFRRMPTNLYVRYRPWVKAALMLPGFAKRWLGSRVSRYAALCALDDARVHS
ncbi:MAG: hypothetical protein LLF97_08370 [Planctomycetaceae bacterium]|nr:hypothetical protein [Planctomycetaceae bacterium]